MRNKAEQLDQKLWGKSRGLERPYSLIRHMLDTAAMLEVLWDSYLNDNQRRLIATGLGYDEPAAARPVVVFWGALHDLGKISVGFQSCDRAAYDTLTPLLAADTGMAADSVIGHAAAGMNTVQKLLLHLGYTDDGPDGPLARLAEIIGGHHGRFEPISTEWNTNDSFQKCLGGDLWDKQRQIHVDVLHDLLGTPEAPETCSVPAAVLITGLVILGDWLVSQENSYILKRQAQLEEDLDAHLRQARQAAPGLLEEAGLVQARQTYPGFAQAFSLEAPNPLQASIIDELPTQTPPGETGILVIAAATGDGKTEAGLEGHRILAEANGSTGLGYFLPTMATSDQLHERVSAFIDRCLNEEDRTRGAVALTHSMAWLSRVYADSEPDESEVVTGEETQQTAAAHRLAPKRWLRGLKKALLAQIAVGTVDQALLGVLPVRHNALRILGLSGKTIVVDEAHAYDPYMQVLLGRLLHWLGAYGCSVVLLSATLPTSVSSPLIKEYLKGTGMSASALRGTEFTVPYPGWLHVSATGRQTRISTERQAAQIHSRNSRLQVGTRPVRHTGPGGTAAGDTRAETLLSALAPALGDQGGCVVVACNTVPDAQATFTLLRGETERRGLDPEEVMLLHARLPGFEREARTRRVNRELGRGGDRPHRRIIVSTQVLEQALDLDADLIISDLAPLAQLLQRAGRCWRHEQWWSMHGRPGGRPRPAWSTGPALVVLDPVGDGGPVPKHWGGDDGVYPAFLLEATSGLLRERGAQTIRVPQDVPALVERIHGASDRFDWDRPEGSASFSAFKGRILAEQGMGKTAAVPRCANVLELADLHYRPLDEHHAATRLGADSQRVLCLFENAEGLLSFDQAGAKPVPQTPEGTRVTVEKARSIMGHTIPVRSDWLGPTGEPQEPPAAWRDHALLSEVVVLRHRVTDGTAAPVRLPQGSFRLDPDLGLVRE